MRVFFCEHCGAPVDAPWSELVIVCQHCHTQHFPGRPDAPVPPRVPVDGRPRLNIGGRTYVLERRLGDGDSSAVYQGRWVDRLGERVVVKVLSSLSDADRMRHEWDVLNALQSQQTAGHDHYVTRLPQPVALGILPGEQRRVAAVYGWKSGFVHTLQQVGKEHPKGVPGPVVVWILKRLLEQLGWVHRAGFVHGAVTPDHVLVHPRDHGALLIGWTGAVPWRTGQQQPLTVLPKRWMPMYPAKKPQDVQATPGLDVAMACLCARTVGGWTASVREAFSPLHRAIGDLLDQGASGTVTDAWALRDALVEASQDAYGPPAYNPLTMRGWR